MDEPVAILILAAGASSRMRGRDKLLEEVDGEPLLRRIAGAATASGCPTVVALPPDAPARRAALAKLPLRDLTVRNAAAGMGTVIAASVRHVPRGRGLMLVLADMPEIDARALATLAALHRAGRITRAASADGRPGHPVIVPARLRDELATLRGDVGARAILERHADIVDLVPLPGEAALTDLDTPEAWDEWRSR